MLVIPGELKGLNDYTKACRSHAFVGAKFKKKQEEKIILAIRRQKIKKYKGKVYISFKWYEKNKRRDKDNIAFAKKFILDALVKEKIIIKDNWEYLDGFDDSFEVDKVNPRIEVEIKELS